MMMRLTLAALMALSTPVLAEQATVLGTAILIGEAPRATFASRDAARAGGGVTLVFPDLASPGDVRIIRATLGEGLPDAGGEASFALPADPDVASVGFVLPDPAPAISILGGALRVDVTGDGQRETLAACLTIEAVQLRATDDAGVEVWQSYVPLGYDVEATCP